MDNNNSPKVFDFFQLQQELILLRNELTFSRETQLSLVNQLSRALQTVTELRIENQMLRDEIARLKQVPPRPKIPPGSLENSGKGSGNNNGNPGRGTDDEGTRHCSKNCYTNVICNEHFVYLTTTNSKNRINFFTILAQGRGEYRFNQDAYDYLAAYKDTEWLIQAIKIRKDPVFYTHNPEKTFFEEFGQLNAVTIRLLTEAGLFASLIEHGVPKNLNIHSDDAPQFAIFQQSLCWIQEERHYRKLIPSHPELAAEIEKVRAGIWQLYQNLKVYKESPGELARKQISEAFDALFNPENPTPYCVLNERLSLTYAKKERLLFVLECPNTPLHTNLSETGGRGAKVKSKISGGTRSDEGRQAWDIFGSLNLTCRRLSICFYEYLKGRFLNLNKIANLGAIIRSRIKIAKNSELIFPEVLGELLNAS